MKLTFSRQIFSKNTRVFVALGVQHAIRMRHIVICGLPSFTIIFNITLNNMIFVGGGDIEHKMCFDFLYNFCLKHFSF